MANVWRVGLDFNNNFINIILIINKILSSFRTSRNVKGNEPTVNPKFISFLKGTLGKMVGLKILRSEDINLSFWDAWPRKFYSIKSYDATKVCMKRN